MSNETLFFSQAFNFSSAVSGGVDPRTGQFGINITIGKLIANNLLGPAIPLTLSYSPMNAANVGFGVGFSLGLTTFDSLSGQLILSTGEQYQVDDELKIQQQKLRNVSIEQQENKYKLTYKDGRVEILDGFGSILNGSQPKVPTRIISAEGRLINLVWDASYSQLQSIADEQGTTLVSIAYPDDTNSTTRITVLPELPEGDDERYLVQLFFSTGYLQKIESKKTLTCTAPVLQWQIEYDATLPNKSIWGKWANALTSPGGFKVQANYASSKGHRFPQSAPEPLKSAQLPRVRSVVTKPGAGQPDMELTYDYSAKNFLGFNSNAKWRKNADCLYNCTDDNYVYTSTETHDDKQGVLTTVTRTYNRFHSLTGEVTKKMRSGKVVTTVTKIIEYNLKKNKGYSEQDPTVQFPSLSTTSWEQTLQENGKSVKKNRSEMTRTVYDKDGNQTQQESYCIDVDNQKTFLGSTVWTYYPPAGETHDPRTGVGCPGDPNAFNIANGIRRFIKSITTTPADSDYDDLQTSTVQYRYDSFNRPKGSLPLDLTAVFKVEERHSYGTQLLAKSAYNYADATKTTQTSKTNEFGRLISTTDTHYPDANATQDVYFIRHVMDIDVIDNTLIRKTTLSTYDEKVPPASQTQNNSRFNGRTNTTVDALGVQATVSYDPIGRVQSATSAMGTAYANQRKFDYEIDTTSPFVIVGTDALGNQMCARFDAAGAPIEDQVKLSGGEKWQRIQSKTYDNAGRVITAISQDFLTGADELPYAKVTTTMTFDDWGQNDSVTTLNDIQSFTVNDPITLKTTTYSTSKGKPTIQSSKTVVTRDIHHRSVTTELFSAGSQADAKPYSKTIGKYDGLNRLRQFTDERGRITTYVYDAFGRVTATTLPKVTNEEKATVVRRQYFAASPSSLVKELEVNGHSMGTRDFDGLGRIRSQSAGGREWSSTYDMVSGSLSRPATVTSPYGTTVKLTYLKELKGKLTSRSMEDVADHASYDYYPKTGELKSATSAGMSGSSSIQNTADVKTGRLLNETFSQGGEPTQYEYTVLGKLKSYTDVTGVMRKVNETDGYGRATSIIDRDVRFDVSYDELGRIDSWTATDLKTVPNPTLTTTVSWDKEDREHTRTVVSSNGNTWSQTLDYFPNHLLKSRSLARKEKTVCAEVFDYDERNRLKTYDCSGAEPVTDAKGLAIRHQTFSFDAFDNLQSVHTDYQDGSSNDMTCVYETKDLCQLVQISHTHPQYPAYISLSYDEAGCLVNDGEGSTFTYDRNINPGRLLSAKKETNGVSSNYGYDALDRLICDDGTALFYRGATLLNQLASDGNVRFVNGIGGNAAQVRSGENPGIYLSGTDASGSILSVESTSHHETLTYGPYGENTDLDGSVSTLGYNGERKSNNLAGYHLGNGYRLYHPGLKRFMAPDILSPFGAGGINSYSYCVGDPINHTDPTGHHFHLFRALVKTDLKIKHAVDHVVHAVVAPVERVLKPVMPVINAAVQIGAAIEDPALGVDEAARAGEKMLAHGAEDVASDAISDAAETAPSIPSAPPEPPEPSAPPLEPEDALQPPSPHAEEAPQPSEPTIVNNSLQGTGGGDDGGGRMSYAQAAAKAPDQPAPVPKNSYSQTPFKFKEGDGVDADGDSPFPRLPGKRPGVVVSRSRNPNSYEVAPLGHHPKLADAVYPGPNSNFGGPNQHGTPDTAHPLLSKLIPENSLTSREYRCASPATLKKMKDLKI
ncbi:RHS repeat-associated core domain-containing protein [Pectobacterium polaris]|uniref:RHS repeat domain-containing protein n=1 Tax=Pectobacterium polaris TaxID=2042057 RepID=UPI001CF5AF51|nr:RHS repeat-associated core domain-containing protein [Pectobacterium polaris]MCA6940485.1 RHS repeat-associated core domain-containing protein [Pectobacterium polaris]MCA6957318.1 RHS repeat-associated core domain-containing protein [Pectobacterium polaris]